MAANLKLIKSRIIMLSTMLFSLSSFAQSYSDQEIGLNIEQVTIQLKNRGFTDPQEINREIQIMREIRISEYSIIKKIDEEVLQKISSQPIVKNGLLKAPSDIPKSEKDALLALYNSTNGSNWTAKTGWDFNTPITTGSDSTGWYGIRVSNGHVVSLNLRLNNVAGYLPKEISDLKYLTTLDLYANKLTGTIPSEIGQLENLNVLYLDSNLLTGSIPSEIGKLQNLTILSIPFNNLTGIPADIGNLSNLKNLNLKANVIVGQIPATIGKLVNLENLSLDLNNFSGNIPIEIGQLKKLVLLNLFSNQLTGTIPNSIGELTSLQELYLDSNKLTGSIPPEIGLLTKLKILFLRFNQLSGDIPKEIGNLSNLTYLMLAVNQLSGSIPKEISQLSKLNFLRLESNKLTGSISPELGKLRNLTEFDLRINKLTGNIPTELGQLTNLAILHLYENELSGTIPYFTNLKLSLYTVYSNKFRFSDLQDQFISNKKINGFQYSPQLKTDGIKTIGAPIGGTITLTMFEDNRFTSSDTFQWYKNNILIAGATSRQYTLTSLKATDAGTYFCRSSHINDPDMSPLILEREPITLNVANCIVLTGTLQTKSAKLYTNNDSDFSFETNTSNLTYEWATTKSTGEIVNSASNNTGLYSYKFTTEGNYTITLTVTDANGCTTTFTKNTTVISRYCAKEAINFAFETTSGSLNYIWSATNSSNIVVNTVTNTTGQYKFTPELPGEYEIKLTTNGAQNCETLFSKKITVENCLPFVSCTKTNVNTPEIHRLFINLINKLSGTPNGSDVNIYAQKEIAALSPYTTDLKAKIYNFSNSNTAISFSFSENAIDSDVKLPKSSTASITGVDLSKYDSAAAKITVAINFSDGSVNSNNGYIRNINFCAKELSCLSHVALVIDESGSIDKNAASKIKKQLKSFILQQALTNDNIGSNTYVSITGMSDSDENTRTDFIRPTKLTNTPEVINQFNKWIDDYGQRGGKTGVSASSDYWRSGLEGSLSYSMKPNIVVMITDGCQTANVTALKTSMKKFNNASGSDSKLPHLYVVGIENGFYVDENFYTNKNSNNDPNNNPGTLVNTVTPHLTKSLQYLLGLPATQFPKSDINQFDIGTYFGHTDFNLLASDDTYFSDKLINAEIVCGTASIKDFCDDCLSFKPEPGKEYILSSWAKEEIFTQVKTYENPIIKIVFYNNKEALDIRAQIIDSLSIKASGAIIDGWQRIVKKFKIPANTITIGIQLENSSPSIPVYFDDIRIHPLQGSVKSFVYDPETFKLMSELDENNYSTFYEYDNEGGLVRVKKETEKGIKTIQETRSGSAINTNP